MKTRDTTTSASVASTAARARSMLTKTCSVCSITSSGISCVSGFLPALLETNHVINHN